MTDELISKKSLLKEIDEVIAQYNWAEDGVIVDILGCARDMVFDHPTAYDIDKVIEQLENEAANNTEFFTDDYRDDYYRGAYAAYCEAIEIVKRGGGDDSQANPMKAVKTTSLPTKHEFSSGKMDI